MILEAEKNYLCTFSTISYGNADQVQTQNRHHEVSPPGVRTVQGAFANT